MSTAQPATGRGGPGAAAGARQRNLGLALVVIATAQLMVVLDATIVNVALPHIQHALGFSGSGLEWVVNAYALTFGGLLLLGGRAGDVLGRRRVFIAGIILFSLASLLGGFATTQAWLLGARALQGVGAAIVAPAALSLVTTTFPEGPPRNRAMGVYAAMSIGGAAVGLIAGGLLTTYASWRWVLFVNVPIGIVVALMAPRAFAETERNPRRFDLPGAITSTLGLAALVFGLSNAATSPNGVSHWGDTKVVASLAAAVVLLVSFVIIESRSPHALMPLRIFRNRDRSAANLIMLCVGTAMFGMFFFLTLFVQTVWGYSALKTGVAYLPMVGMIMLMAGVSSQLVARIGARPLLIAGSTIAAGGMFWLSRITEHSTYAGGLLGPMMVTAAGLGMLFMPITLVALSKVAGPGRRAGLQPAQHRPAGRRGDRAGRARHRRLDRGVQQRPQPGHRAGRGRGQDGARGARHRRADPQGHLRPRAGRRVLPRVPGLLRDRGDRAGDHAGRDPGHEGGPGGRPDGARRRCRREPGRRRRPGAVPGLTRTSNTEPEPGRNQRPGSGTFEQ